MAKVALICLFALFCLQLAYASPRVARDTPEKKTDQIDEAFNAMKTNLDQLLKSVQDNDMMKELNEKIQKFGADIAAQGKQLAEKIQTSVKTD